MPAILPRPAAAAAAAEDAIDCAADSAADGAAYFFPRNMPLVPACEPCKEEETAATHLASAATDARYLERLLVI
jgi:hypothetical protein